MKCSFHKTLLRIKTQIHILIIKHHPIHIKEVEQLPLQLTDGHIVFTWRAKTLRVRADGHTLLLLEKTIT
jgi:hypothetical protein